MTWKISIITTGKWIVTILFPLVLLGSVVVTSAYAGGKLHDEKDNGLLLIVPDQWKLHDTSILLKDLLVELLNRKVTIIENREYVPVVDEFSYGGFIYLGASEGSKPLRSLYEDIRKTTKPVLWIYQHAGSLGSKYFSGKGIKISKEVNSDYDVVLYKGIRPINTPTVVRVEADKKRVLYNVSSTRHKKIHPGAVHYENFTYVSYFPGISPIAPDFLPFVVTIRNAFGPRRSQRYMAAENDYNTRLDIARKDSYRTGIHLPVYSARSTAKYDGYDSDRWHENLLRIKKTGAEWVSLLITFYQQDVQSSQVFSHPKYTPTLSSLNNIIQDAHAMGFLVRLTPVVNLVHHRPEEWRGLIQPMDRKQWWRSYREKIIAVAELARENEVESLNLGAELSTMQQDKRRWIALLNAVKNEVKYTGMVGYQVNFNMLESFGWMKELDYVGIAAYWPLSDDRDPESSTLSQSWEKIAEELQQWRSEISNISLEFSELGYVSQPYTSTMPYAWSPHKGKKRHLSEQLQCYQALYEFLKNHPEINGVHIFASTKEDSDPRSKSYTPFGKPSQKVVEQIMTLR